MKTVVEFNLDEAHRRTGIRRQALLDALRDGRLAGTLGGARGSRGMRNAWRISEADLDAFVASLPACRYRGCSRRAASPSGACSGPHARALNMFGVPRSPETRAKISASSTPRSPETRAKISASKQGHRLVIPLAAGTRAAISAGLRRFFSSSEGEIERERRAAFASRPRPDVSERNLEEFRVGGPRFWSAYNWWQRAGGRGATRQKWLGRIHANKPPARGGRTRGRPRVDVTEEQCAEIMRLASLGWGRPAIASRLHLSQWVVRNVLGRQ